MAGGNCVRNRGRQWSDFLGFVGQREEFGYF